MDKSPTTSDSLSYETKTIIVILSLFFFWPAGIILMWLWMHTWPAWVKILVTLPIVLGALFMIALVVFLFFMLIFVGSHHNRHDYYEGYPAQQNMQWETYQEEYPASPSAVLPTIKPASGSIRLTPTMLPQAR